LLIKLIELRRCVSETSLILYEFHRSFWIGYCGQIYKMSTLILSVCRHHFVAHLATKYCNKLRRNYFIHLADGAIIQYILAVNKTVQYWSAVQKLNFFFNKKKLREAIWSPLGHFGSYSSLHNLACFTCLTVFSLATHCLLLLNSLLHSWLAMWQVVIVILNKRNV
jgi:hypothetical protein